jgi:hypothetical protein
MTLVKLMKLQKIVLDAVLKWKVHQNWIIWAGQTELPGNRERVVSSHYLLVTQVYYPIRMLVLSVLMNIPLVFQNI